jgi:hypothetical protein
MEKRFECLLDPTDTWMVWDTNLDAPAEFAEHVLLGLEWERAEALCSLLNSTLVVVERRKAA